MIRIHSKYYWWCQLFGWSIVGISFLFLALIFQRNFANSNYILRTATIMSTGFISTHLLSLYIKKMNLLLLPVEKALPRLIIAVIATTFVFVFLETIVLQTLNLYGYKQQEFITRLLASALNNGIFVIPWSLIYCFYSYYQKTNKEQLENRRLQRLLKKKK